MSERLLHGEAASPGTAAGPAWRGGELDGAPVTVAPELRAQELKTALEALGAAEAELEALAGRLEGEQAEIVRASVLMAADPALAAAVEQAVHEGGADAPTAILQAASINAEAIAALGDATLAARADDVRSLGRRAARLARGSGAPAPVAAGSILVAADIGPADVAELAEQLAGIALAGGGATAHAAIVARSLGLPMVTGLPDELLRVASGAPLVLDGDAGSVALEPSLAAIGGARRAMSARRELAQRARAECNLPAVTRDGQRIGVLANVASVAEAELALRHGAEGIGLLRTELAFMDASNWPTASEHWQAIEPILAAMAGHPAVVRVLDFGADKAPAFLRATTARGIGLLLEHPDALSCQLCALLRAAAGYDVRVLLPLVDHPAQVEAVRELLTRAADELGRQRLPALGAMVETPTAAGNAAALAARADFISIGTNDLTAAALHVDRFGAGRAQPHHPRVLALIARTVDAAHDAGVTVEVCGEAASDPLMLPLLVGLGVDEVSVGAARVGTVRRWIRGLDAATARNLASAALALEQPDQVAAAVAPIAAELAALESGDASDEGLQRGGRVVAFGA